MPLISIWCAMCPDNLEATSITFFTGLMNFSYNISNYFGASILYTLSINKEDFDKVWIPYTIQNVYLLIMTIAIVFVRFPAIAEKQQEKDLELGVNEVD